MQLSIEMKFLFQQIQLQEDGGWCTGFCLQLLRGIAKETDKNIELTPVLGGSVAAKLRSKFYLDGDDDEQRISRKANYTEEAKKLFNTRGNVMFRDDTIKGDYISSFTTAQVAYIYAIVDDVKNSGAPGSKYGTSNSWWNWMTTPHPNHACVAVWDAGGEVFLFDPNCGGFSVKNVKQTQGDTIPKLIDCAFDEIYKQYDRLKGTRTARINSMKAVNVKETLGMYNTSLNKQRKQKAACQSRSSSSTAI